MSVIVPAWNEQQAVGRFAAALRAQTLPSDRYEVILVDDGSSDATAAESRRAKLTTVELARRCGPYAARNAGARVARGQVLAFTDVDCVPAPDWLERGVEALRRTGADVLGGCIEVPMGANPNPTALLDLANFVDQERAVSRGYALGGNMWLTRPAFDELGGFNERLHSGGDQELGRRATETGRTLVFGPGVRVVHEPYRRRRDLARKARRIGRGAALHRRHARGALNGRPLLCSRPGNYLPWRRVFGADRLVEAGYDLDRLRTARLLFWSYWLVQLPMIVGNLEGALRGRPVAPLPAMSPARRADGEAA